MTGITIVEVSPRDGLQNEKTILSTDAKVDLITRLVDAGARRIEAVSFAHPRLVPTMADAEAVMERVPRPEGAVRRQQCARSIPTQRLPQQNMFTCTRAGTCAISLLRACCRSRQFDGAAGRDVGGELAQRDRGQAHTQGCEAAAQRGVDLGGGPSPLGARQGAQHGSGVAASLLFHLPATLIRAGFWRGGVGRGPSPGPRRRRRGPVGGRRGVHGVCAHATELPDVEPMFEAR